MSLSIFLPQDRLRVLANQNILSDRTNGSVLFADISGFTALTEALRNTLGPRRGAEELTRRIDSVYSTLISEIERHGGCVISFAGDSMLCWFDEAGIKEQDLGNERSSASGLAVACGLFLQRMMRAYSKITLPDKSTIALTLKVSIATGIARRFVVGDPNIRYLDVLAGATVARTATAEHLAQKGEVLIDETTANALDDIVAIQEWRHDSESGERFAVVTSFMQPVETPIISALDIGYFSSEELRAWLHAPLFEREQTGQGAFLTEFRPCTTLFIRFTGIDFDSVAAETQLNTFIETAQQIAARHSGTLLDITIGDKGSYIYISFGVLSTHEDDTRRAVNAAFELRETTRQLDFLQPLQIGITQGTLRVGAYGGQTRKTFGALGDEVNLAARLMTTASAGEILVSSQVHNAVEPYFVFEPRLPIALKGKAERVPVFALTGQRKQRAIRLQEPNYALPMVGRANELKIIAEKLDLAISGKAQAIGIIAEAGMGKSRLVAEAIRLAHKKGFVGYGGACQSDGVNTPYLAWKSIWSAFFDIDPAAALKKQMRSVENTIEDYAPSRLRGIPLLNIVLETAIPENDFTSNLEPQYRKSALTALLEDCLRAAAKEQPILIVIEDVHWIDALSHDLLEDLAKMLVDSPICFVLAYRPPQITRLQAPRLEALSQFTKIELHELDRLEAEQAIRAKLVQLYPARGEAVSAQLVDQLMARAEGNPFYLEELLNYLRDRGLDPRDPADLEKIEFPESLHTLVLSRIDQLSEREKTTLRVASIVGRLFRAAWLTGYYPALGDIAHVKVDLDKLDSMEITPLDSEPEMAYLFKHIVTHEVTYENLPFGLRAQLHEQLARFLEREIAQGVMSEDILLETLVYHYVRSANKAKQREYLRKAAEAAEKSFANHAALAYYSELLFLLNDRGEKIEIYLKRGALLEWMGQYTEAEADYRTALESATNTQNAAFVAEAQFALGMLGLVRSDYDAGLEWLEQAKTGLTGLGDAQKLGQVLNTKGMILYRKSRYAEARDSLNEGLSLARQVDNKTGMAQSLKHLGIVEYMQGDYVAAQALFEKTLMLRRETGNKVAISASLGDLGFFAYAQGDYATARQLIEEFLTVSREIGDKFSVVLALGNLGSVALAEGDIPGARAMWKESMTLCKEMDEKSIMAYNMLSLGLAGFAEGTPEGISEARQHITSSLLLRKDLGEPLGLASSLIGMARLALNAEDPYRAAQVLSAVESALKTLHAPVEPEMRDFHAQTLEGVRTALEKAAFESAWQAGEKLSLEEAVRLALDNGE